MRLHFIATVATLCIVGCSTEGLSSRDAALDTSTAADAGTAADVAALADRASPQGGSTTFDASLPLTDTATRELDVRADATATLFDVAAINGTARTRAHFGECVDERKPWTGFAPVAPGRRSPLFVWVVGTFANYQSDEVIIMLREMAARGFVAVSPSYDNGIVNGCFNLNEKSMCVFDAAKPDSLVATICARADVDCSRGIVTGGHSQGAGLALLAREHDARVEAVWAMGGTCDYLLNQDTGLCDPNGAATDTDCAHFSQTTIDPSRIRIVNGENDEYGARVEYERITGRVCPPTEMSCLAADGSGWFVIPNAAVQDGNADHCYVVNSTDGAWCPGIDATHPLDIRWLPPSRETWSLLTNLEWLASFAR